MKLFDLFGKRTGEDTDGKNRKVSDIRELEIYSGMRVVVENPEGQMLFIAKLQDPQRNTAKLYQYSDAEVFRDEDKDVVQQKTTIPVKIRGYNDSQRKAVFMEGVISIRQKHIWQVENLIITRVENERSFPRLSMDIDALVITSGGTEDDERTCRLLNISVGGASISSEYRYHKGEKFILKVRLLEDKSPSVMYCEVLRVIEKDISRYEYGCHFLELTEVDQEQITQDIELLTKRSAENSCNS